MDETEEFERYYKGKFPKPWTESTETGFHPSDDVKKPVSPKRAAKRAA